MDDYERTTQRIRTETVTPAEPVVPVTPVAEVPVAAQPVYAQPVVQAAPIMAARPAVSDRIVTEREVVHDGPTTLEMTRRIVGLGFGILQGLIILRVILLLLIANRDNGIVEFILNVTAPFVNPFRDMFSIDRLAASGSVLDIAALVALIGWTLIEMLIFAILNLGSRRRTVVG